MSERGTTKKIYTLEGKKFKICFEPQHFRLSFERGHKKFALLPLTSASLVWEGQELSLENLEIESVTPWQKGRGQGLDLLLDFKGSVCWRWLLSVWLPCTEDYLALDWQALDEDNPSPFSRFNWPSISPLGSGYSVLPRQQGEILPEDWPVALEKLPFDGQFCTSASYMPWLGQVGADSAAWMLLAETPWDGGYRVQHQAGGPTRELGFYWLPSLGTWSYKRRMRLYLWEAGADYNTLAKTYRRYVQETGHFKSLKEKAERNPRVCDLIGASVVHLNIKTHVEKASSFYDPEHPEKNDCLVSFAEREAQLRELSALGADKFYVHLDGWASPGYDNQHPDILPISEEAGGASGLLSLARSLQSQGNLIGLHDQYRDYYFTAQSFSRSEAIEDSSGHNPEHARWAGGRQSYLCASLAPYYLKRNFQELLATGFKPDCSYLDVFTCNEPDECFNPLHRMSRRECLDYRLACFAYLNSLGIVPSSEECSDWAMAELVFCHYGPHTFMLETPGSPRSGIPVPLFNLVYHDAIILPWPTEPASQEQEDYLLYCLLNAGMPYLIRDGAYAGIDGAFGSQTTQLKSAIERSKIAQNLQARLAYCEMLEHRLLDVTGMKQEALYSDGTCIQVDFAAGTYLIKSN